MVKDSNKNICKFYFGLQNNIKYLVILITNLCYKVPQISNLRKKTENQFLFRMFVILFISTISYGQLSNKIGTKNTELKSLQGQITKLEDELNSLAKKEKSNLKVLKKMDQQNLLLGKKIKTLEKEEKVQEVKIGDLNGYE